MGQVLLLNFSHPITPEQSEQIAKLVGVDASELKVVDVPVQVGPGNIEEQMSQLLDKVPITAREWQDPRKLVNLPGLSLAAGVLLAQLDGRIGDLPAILRLKRMEGSVITRFEVEEIVNLAQLRDRARLHRWA